MNKPKAKGTAAETALVNYAKTNGFPSATRITLAGAQDCGDVLLEPGLIAEVKNRPVWSDLDIDTWLRETDTEVGNMAYRYPNVIPWAGFLVVKRPGKGYDNVGNWWVFDWTYPAGVPVVTQFRLHEFFNMLLDLRGRDD